MLLLSQATSYNFFAPDNGIQKECAMGDQPISDLMLNFPKDSLQYSTLLECLLWVQAV